MLLLNDSLAGATRVLVAEFAGGFGYAPWVPTWARRLPGRTIKLLITKLLFERITGLVELSGIEPLTSSLRTTRSPN
jgi:hypothetical protein